VINSQASSQNDDDVVRDAKHQPCHINDVKIKVED
jgi:hypothetical protein